MNRAGSPPYGRRSPPAVFRSLNRRCRAPVLLLRGEDGDLLEVIANPCLEEPKFGAVRDPAACFQELERYY
ncbi:MAG: hypothetical protein HPZ91_20220 [Lentisphaeria bacterium]|nr:hypothetical protein [Lentisphaeria bacterium]